MAKAKAPKDTTAPPPAPTAAAVEASEQYVPNVAATAVAEAPPPKIPPCPPFLFAFRAERWTVMGDAVIPCLSKWPLRAGVNGIEETKDGKIRTKEAMAAAEDRGLKLIPFDVDGPGTSYIRRPRGTSHVHLAKWERTYPGSAQIDCDEVGYIAFCRGLVDRGVIPHPRVYVLERMLAALGKQVEEYQRADDKGSVVGALRRHLKAIEAELVEARKRENVGVAADEAVDPTSQEAA